jgi:hypothetical protein
VKYSIENTFEILIDLVVPNANDFETVSLEVHRAICLSLVSTLGHTRRTAIEFDNHSRVIAGEIDDEFLDSNLPPKVIRGVLVRGDVARAQIHGGSFSSATCVQPRAMP